jgi:hypothetical protein
MSRFTGAQIDHYEELLNIRPEYMKIHISDAIVCIGEYPHKYLPIIEHTIGNTKVKSVCGPSVLMFLLSCIFTDRKNADIYRAYYRSLVNIMNDPAMEIKDTLYKGVCNLYPSVCIMTMREKFCMKLITDNVSLEIPKGYYEGKPRPTFDASNSRFFKTSGRIKIPDPIDDPATSS